MIHYSIESATFSSGDVIKFPARGVTVFVGPNNSGKSLALRNLNIHIANGGNTPPPQVVRSITDRRQGTAEDVASWLRSRARVEDRPDGVAMIRGLGIGVSTGGPFLRTCELVWGAQPGLGVFAPTACACLAADARLTGARAEASFAPADGAPATPLQRVYLVQKIEDRLSGHFKRAFGEDLVVDRLGGTQISLRVGIRPNENDLGGRLSMAYATAVQELPLLDHQGDGMRSFAGTLLHLAAGEYLVALIDEPEAFLHPGQARQLGAFLASLASPEELKNHGDQAALALPGELDSPPGPGASPASLQADHLIGGQGKGGTQAIVATHSGDLLRGVLDAASDNVTVVRLTRENTKNFARQIAPEAIRELWKDPLLRISNVLEALFHETAVVCEGDGDARFYRALMEALAREFDSPMPDVHFLHCGGKDRMPMIAAAMKSVDVPTHFIADLDLLNSDQKLRDLWEKQGGAWDEIATLHKRVDAAVAATRKAPRRDDVRRGIDAVLDTGPPELVDVEITRMRAMLKTKGGLARRERARSDCDSSRGSHDRLQRAREGTQKAEDSPSSCWTDRGLR